MSEVKNIESAYAPAIFSNKGRLPSDPQSVINNYDLQMAETEKYRQKLNAQRGLRGASTCARSLHISLFFDGTNNNEPYDTRKATPPHPTNIARLYHASLEQPESGYFRYYIPGVGTPFPEIGEMDFSMRGLAFANRGEDRINWGLLQIADALSFALNNKQGLDLPVAQAKLKTMATTWPLTALGKSSRRQAMASLLEPLRVKVETTQPKVLAIKLFVYGFSRGAAEARTFVTWLSELFDTPEGAEDPEQALLGLPLTIEFLGLLDTVASVGSAHAAPFADGHMDWADGTQQLPDVKTFPEWIKVCRHFVAAHEQRLCFPLDSIRYADGLYPPYAREVVYPGVHSDVGGGYPPEDQGKARGGSGELMSQIVLHDLYAEAFAAGAPLTVPEAVLPDKLRQISPARHMVLDTLEEFDTTPILIDRFNAWRSTLGLVEENTAQTPPNDESLRLGHSLEDAMAAQLAWLTGWRIERLARGSYANEPFYGKAIQTNASLQETQKAKREAEIADAKRKRKEARGQENEAQLLLGTASPPTYEPVKDQQQIHEAAVEFEHDYQGWRRDQSSVTGWVVDVALRDTVYLLNDDDEQQEYERIKAEGEVRAKELFVEVGTNSNKFRVTDSPQKAAVVALFDDQVHDSRAWFLHDAMSSRELWGDYFRYRMVYFGGETNKRMTPVVVAGRVVGIALVLGGVYSIRRHGWKGLAGTLGAASVGYQVINVVSGKVEPFLPGAEKVLQPTFAIGEVVAQQTQAIIEGEEALRMQSMQDYLKRTGGLVEQAKELVS
ncbi:T6SS phospholipase effector Tle1-like catalytic domain-containing protein [Pseudomonas sp. EA_65y_Pfl1_P120]|uniref:T6SS phospholipase effector Tle1-like catalytic domain-containing protein n=1 Tax=Pseudomonas sp. EA_65y_Pfl1_P120 TaxID=3088693 RepID=UPI0030DD6424